MTVKELILELMQLNPEDEVRIPMRTGEFGDQLWFPLKSKNVGRIIAEGYDGIYIGEL